MPARTPPGEDKTSAAGATLEMFGFSGPPLPAPQLGRRLVELGILSETQLTSALEIQARAPHRMLGAILTEEGFLSDESLAGVLGDPSLAPAFDPRTVLIDPSAVQLLPQDVAQTHKVLAISSGGGSIIVAVSEGSTTNVAEELKRFLPIGARIEPRYWPEADLSAAIASVYAQDLTLGAILSELNRLEGAPPASRPSREESWRNPVVRLANAILLEAVRVGASQIHFEPGRKGVRLSFRIGSRLQDEKMIPRGAWPDLLARFARLAGWRETAEAMLGRAPRGKTGAPLPAPPAFADGVVRLKLGNRAIDAGTHALLTEAGVALTVAIDELRREPFAFDRLGLAESNARRLRAAALRAGGVVVIAGPDGAGRAMTLYSLLAALRTPDRCIVALDAGAGYHIEGLRQVRLPRGDTAGALPLIEAALTQDPDLLVIGSIDEPALAEAAFAAAGTGRKVICTLTAGTALAALARLSAMGLPLALLAAQLSAIHAQRLLRRLCPVCKSARAPTPADLAEGQIPAGLVAQLSDARGCPTCRETGYKGHLLLSEILDVDEDLRDLLAHEAPQTEILDAAGRRGFAPLAADGLLRLENGEISLSDLARAVDLTGLSSRESGGASRY